MEVKKIGNDKTIISVDECHRSWTCSIHEVTHGERNYIHLISIQLVSKHTVDATQLHLGRITCMQMNECLISPCLRVCVCKILLYKHANANKSNRNLPGGKKRKKMFSVLQN